MSSVDPDAWLEFKAMSSDECREALVYIAGYDPAAFAQLIDVTRASRERARLSSQVAAACRREQEAEVSS